MIEEKMTQKRLMILGMAVTVAVLFATATVWIDHTGTNAVPSLFPPSEGDPRTAFVLNITFPKISDSYLVYKTVTPEVTTDYVEDIGRTFGLTGTAKPYIEATGEICLVDETKGVREQVSVYRYSGAVVYEIPDKGFPTYIDSQPILPSENDAKEIALDYLMNRNLLPRDAEFTNVEVNQIIGNATVSYNVTLAVRFSRNFNDIPVCGHDGLSVIIGNNSEVLGLVMNWRAVEPYKEISIKTPEEAYEDLIAGKSVQPPLETMLDQATINEISIGYWMEPRINKQEFVLPVYAFTGTAIDSEGREEPFRDFVSAVRSEGLESLGVVY